MTEKPEKKRVNSKNKGNTFERKISNKLSERFVEKTGLLTSFRRNADSGSFFGGSNKKRTETHDLDKANFGDIITPPGFAYSLECKHYKEPPTFSSLIAQNWKTLDVWIEQAEQDAASSGKLPAIIVKFNLVPEIVVLKGLPAGIDNAVINYKGYVIISLDDWLKLGDEEFFNG